MNYKAGGRHWIIDSGCSQHMTGTSRMFDSIEKNDSGIESITFGNNKKGKVVGLGKIAISNDMSISNVLLVESLDFNFLSMTQICVLGFKCIFGANEVEVISIHDSSLHSRALGIKISIWLTSVLVKLVCLLV